MCPSLPLLFWSLALWWKSSLNRARMSHESENKLIKKKKKDHWQSAKEKVLHFCSDVTWSGHYQKAFLFSVWVAKLIIVNRETVGPARSSQSFFKSICIGTHVSKLMAHAGRDFIHSKCRWDGNKKGCVCDIGIHSSCGIPGDSPPAPPHQGQGTLLRCSSWAGVPKLAGWTWLVSHHVFALHWPKLSTPWLSHHFALRCHLAWPMPVLCVARKCWHTIWLLRIWRNRSCLWKVQSAWVN